jgi:glycosyltransferase involved in cell wall biosynthesis
VIDHGVNSLLFAAGDRQEFLDQIRGLIQNPVERERLASRARADMEDCSWRKATERLIGYYQTAIRAHRRWNPSEWVA